MYSYLLVGSRFGHVSSFSLITRMLMITRLITSPSYSAGKFRYFIPALLILIHSKRKGETFRSITGKAGTLLLSYTVLC